MQTGTKAGRLKAKKDRILTENVPDAPATIPPSTKATNVWCAIESIGKRKMPAEPQTTPEQAKLTQDHISPRVTSSGICDKCLNLEKSRYLKIDTEIIAENHMIRIVWEMTSHSIKLRMIELKRVAIIPTGAFL